MFFNFCAILINLFSHMFMPFKCSFMNLIHTNQNKRIVKKSIQKIIMKQITTNNVNKKKQLFMSYLLSVLCSCKRISVATNTVTGKWTITLKSERMWMLKLWKRTKEWSFETSNGVNGIDECFENKICFMIKYDTRSCNWISNEWLLKNFFAIWI